MSNEQQRHDISDEVWSFLEPHLPGQRGQWGGIAQDNRRFINGVFWILRTGAPWRDLPPFYGKWGTVYQRFRRWRDKGIWEKLLEILVDEPDFEWLMIDASHCKVHPHAAGARGGNQDMSRTKGGSIPRFTLPWMQMVCRSEYLSQRVPELIAKKLFTWLMEYRRKHYWPIVGMTPIRSLLMPLILEWISSFQLSEIASSSGSMTVTCIGFVIWWKMLFCTWNAGEALLLDMPKLQHLFWQQCKFVALLFGVLFWLDLV